MNAFLLGALVLGVSLPVGVARQKNLLFSIEYDKLFPHCLQTLLQVSILSKSTERGLNGSALARKM